MSYGFPLFDLSRDQKASPDLASGIDGIQVNFDAATPISLGSAVSKRTQITQYLGTLPTKPNTATASTSTSLGRISPSVSLKPGTPASPPITILPKKIISNSTILVGKGGLSQSNICANKPRTFPDGTVQYPKESLNCKYEDCPGTSTSENPYQSYIDKFKEAFGVTPTEGQLNSFVNLWTGLGHQPSADEFNCYVTTGNPVCDSSSETTTTDTGSGSGGVGGGSAPVDEKTGESMLVEEKKKPWILYAGIAATTIGVIGLIFIKKQ